MTPMFWCPTCRQAVYSVIEASTHEALPGHHNIRKVGEYQ